MIVRPDAGADGGALRRVFDDILGLAGTQPRGGHPVPLGGPPLRWPPRDLDVAARLQRRPGRSLLASRIGVAAHGALVKLMFWSGIGIGGFVPSRYLKQLVENSDVRKFDDGLMMTLDCTPDLADRIEARLRAARADGLVTYGLYRQAAALVTCMGALGHAIGPHPFRGRRCRRLCLGGARLEKPQGLEHDRCATDLRSNPCVKSGGSEAMPTTKPILSALD